MVWEENSRICLHMQLIAILSRIGVYTNCPDEELSLVAPLVYICGTTPTKKNNNAANLFIFDAIKTGRVK